MKPAVFLDRDGVINDLVLNPGTGGYEPPHSPDNFFFIPDAIASLRILQEAGYYLFLVSNQPDYAKGKTTLEQIHAVQERLDHLMKSEGVLFREYYYCYHHPTGIVPEYSFACECRKPKPFFILKAAREYGIDLTQSWMVGDRDTDIVCGKEAGTRTILIKNSHSSGYQGLSKPEFTAANLKDAVRIILHT
jgi:D-glycero-D-manno-heptose 1,7-bisphosphate phosphatase